MIERERESDERERERERMRANQSERVKKTTANFTQRQRIEKQSDSWTAGRARRERSKTNCPVQRLTHQHNTD